MPREYEKRADESHDQWLRRVGTVRVTKSGNFQEETFTMKNLDPDQWHVVAKADPNWFVQAVEKGARPAGDPYQLTMTAAKAAHPELSEARAFAKFVDAHPVMQKYAFAPVDPMAFLRGEPLRKTRDLEEGPQASLTPTSTGGENGDRRGSSPGRRNAPSDIGNVGRSAIDQLDKLVKEQLKARNLSTAHYARVFAEIYTDPTNAALAETERLQNRPGGVERKATG